LSSSKKENIFCISDPKLSEHYKINSDVINLINTKTANTTEKINPMEDMREKIVYFPSKKKNDSNYLCTIIMQNIERKVFCVSVFLIDTYLGRYAYKANFYFRQKGRNEALSCFNRISKIVKNIRSEICSSVCYQSEIPYLLKRSLLEEKGEIEPVSNHIAIYLDPKNVSQRNTLASESIITIPKPKSIEEELDMFGGKQ
jgi:hypothetical protein